MKKIDSSIIYKSLRGKATEAEEKLIGQWYQDNPDECDKVISELHKLIDLTEMSSIMPSKGQHEAVSGKSKVRRFVVASLKVAAVVVLMLSVSLFTYQKTTESFSSQMITMQVPNGERVSITLPDSSTVFLNSGAKLQYPVVFRKDLRSVNLTGEAMFDVKHDSVKPFVVNTFASQIKVLGTKFNVRSDERSGEFETTLLEGCVRVKNLINTNARDIVMQPNERVCLRNGLLELKKMKSSDEIYWVNGLVGIDGCSFARLMKRFETAFGVKISVELSELPDITMVRGKIRISEGVDNALKILQHAAKFSFRRDRETGEIIIY